MLIEIDGHDQQVLLRGQSCTLQELRQKYRWVKEQAISSLDIPKLMCTQYGFTQLPYNAVVEVAFVIDTDTDRIYVPSY